MTGYCPAGLPHSEIPGSKPVCGSPRLIAAYRVLHRLSAPRHPPCTLSSLTKLELTTLNPANPIASNPIQLSRNLIWDRWDPRFLRAFTRWNRASQDALERPLSLTHRRSDYNKEPVFVIPVWRRLVELIGLEPTTSALQGRRSPS